MSCFTFSFWCSPQTRTIYAVLMVYFTGTNVFFLMANISEKVFLKVGL